MTNVTCGLTAKRPALAPSQTLLIKYETTFLKMQAMWHVSTWKPVQGNQWLREANVTAPAARKLTKEGGRFNSAGFPSSGTVGNKSIHDSLFLLILVADSSKSAGALTAKKTSGSGSVHWCTVYTASPCIIQNHWKTKDHKTKQDRLPCRHRRD